MIKRLIALTLTLASFAVGSFYLPTQVLSIGEEPTTRSYSVKAIDQQLVCLGSLIRSGGSKGTKLGVFDLLGEASLRITAEDSGEGRLETMSLVPSASSQSIELPSERYFEADLISEPLSLSISGRSQELDQGSALLTASQVQVAKIDSMKGLAASSCEKPLSDFWLVGGSTDTGRESLLVLTNPSPIDAIADLRIFTDLGEITVAGLTGISVLAKSKEVISLAAFAPGIAELTVQVKSQSAKLSGWIQQKAVRGTAAAGLDLVSPVTEFKSSHVIPGLLLRGTSDSQKLFNISEEYSDVRNVVRIFSPEGSVANVTVQVISTETDTFGAVFTGTVGSASVKDFHIEDLKDGDYTIFITSDQPILASARVVRSDPSSNPGTDFAWLNSADAISTVRVVATPALGVSYLSLGNNSSEAVTLVVTDLVSGEVQAFSIPTFSTVSVEVSNPISVRTESGAVFGNLVILSEGQIASLSISDPKNIGSKVQVGFR